jgi:hypothetical protein
MTWWRPLDRILTTRRLTYALIAGGVLWFAWMISVLLGPGNMDLAGQVIGTDYLQFYSAGVTLRQDQSANLYNFPYQSQLEQTIAGPGLTSFHAFITPPFLAWLYVPFTLLPYSLSFLFWSLIGFLFLWASIRLITADQPNKSFIWSLTWFPIFAAISFGQNSLLSLFLFSLTYWLWKKDKYLLAGLVSSLLLFKPQLVLGLGLLWLLDRRSSWKSLVGLVAGGTTLAGLCFWLLPDASLAYINLARSYLPGMMYQDGFPLWHLHSLRGFWTMLFPGIHWLSEGLSLVLSIAGVVVYILFWQNNRNHKSQLFAGAICLTIWITPHAMIYDWSILLIPAILFWQAYPNLKPLLITMYALVWIAMFLSTPLTLIQLRFLPIAVQISIPVFFYALYVTYKYVMKIPPEELVVME